MIRRVVDAADYKPGWELSVRTMSQIPHLWVKAEVQDSAPPHRLIVIDHVIPIPPELLEDDAPAAHAQAWVRNALLSIERHEVGEWLRFDGLQAFYPDHGHGNPYA